MFCSLVSLIIFILRPSVAIRHSDAKADRVRIALLVVMFDMFARSSLLGLMLSVLPSSSMPYFSLRKSRDSASLARTCF